MENKTETFSWDSLPENAEQLAGMAEMALDTPFKAAALTVVALCRYGADPRASVDMLNALKGPTPLSAYEEQFLRDRLAGKAYKPFSFFAGAVPDNDYTPSNPYTLSIRAGASSFSEAGYATLYVQSSGADTPRQIKLREKPSSGQWFLWEQFLLSDIRTPAAADPWK